MKILVFGFSVTGEPDGFVERCNQLCPEHEVFRIAIGGLQPDQGWHLIPGIVRQHRPDALIIEEATAIYRKRPETPQLTSDHTSALEHVFRVCNDIGVRVGFLDLPLSGVDESFDWLLALHAGLSKKYGIPHVALPLDESLLRDIVHTNEDGKDAYAAALQQLIGEIASSEADFTELGIGRGFEAFSMDEVEVTEGSFGEFSRTGLTVKLLELPEGKACRVELPKTVTISGFIMTMGPVTGDLAFDLGETHASLHCYDRHCYYLRLNGKPITPAVAGEFTVHQGSALPQDELLKGEKNLGPRVGGIAYILFKTDANA